MDDGDRAADFAERERQAILGRHAARSPRGGSADCLACGDPIPPARLAALPEADRCAPCASGREAMR